MLNTSEVSAWTVLIVDDDLDNIAVPRKILTYYGAQVYTAENGLLGLKVLRKMPILPAFILLDLSMPEMDGWQMLKEIRDNPRTTALKVIALTAHAMESDQERALAAGFDGYIVKPFRLATFLDEIKNYLSQAA